MTYREQLKAAADRIDAANAVNLPILRKREKLERLAAGGATEGEREAARLAMERLAK